MFNKSSVAHLCTLLISFGARGRRAFSVAAMSLVAVAAALAAPSTPVITTATTVTAGKAGIAASCSDQTNVTFNWTFSPASGGTVTAGQGTHAITYTAGPVGTYTLTCVATDTSANTATGTKSISMIAAPVAPTITLSAGDAANGVTVSSTGHTASIAAQTGMTYLWTASNGAISSGATTTNVTYSAGPVVGTMNLTCTVKNAANDTIATTQPVTVIAAPTGPITASKGAFTNLTTVTNTGTGYTASVPAQPGTFLWTVTNAAFDSGTTSNSVTFHPTVASGTVSLTCKVTNPAGTLATITKSLTVVPLPSTATITTAADITEGAATHAVAATNISSATYLWAGAGATYASNTAISTTYTTTVTNGTANASAATQPLSCTITNQDGTSAVISKNVNVWAAPAAPVVVTTKNDGTTAETQVTASTAGHKAHVAAQNNVTYSWTLIGGSVSAGNSTNEITFTAGTTVGAAAFKATCTVTNKAGTAASAFATEDVIAAPASSVGVSLGAKTNLSVVTANATGYTAAVASQAGMTYAWTGTNVVFDSSQTAASVTFHPSAASGSATVQCVVTNSLSATATGTKTLTILADPNTAVITTAADITENATTSHAISTPTVSGATYAWTGATFASQAASTTYKTSVVNGTANVSTVFITLQVVITNPDGVSATRTTNVNVWALPAAAVITQNQTNVTVSTTGHTASVPAAPANTRYAWSAANATITAPVSFATPSATNTAITFTAGGTPGTQNLILTCTAYNPAGGTVAATAKENVYAVPTATITVGKGAATNLTSVSFGNTGLTATVPDLGAGSTYAWSITNGTFTGGVSGSGTRQATFTVAGPVGQLVTINVTSTNPAGSSANGSKTVTILASPTSATITTPADITEGGASHAVSATTIAGASYAWSGATETFAGQTAATTYTTTQLNGAANASAPTITLSVLITNPDGASATKSTNVNVWALPAAPTVATFKGDGITPETKVTSATTGHIAQVTSVVPANTRYAWTIADGSITSAAPGTPSATNTAVTFTAGSTAGTQALTLTCTAYNPAGGTVAVTAKEDVFAAPSATITAFKGVRTGLAAVSFGNTNLQASVAAPAGTTVAWGTPVNGVNTGGVSTPTLTFRVNGNVGATLTLSVTVTNGAGTVATGTRNLLIVPAAHNAVITTAANITQGAPSHTISATGISGATYAWSPVNAGEATFAAQAASTSYTTTVVNGSVDNASAQILSLQVLVTNQDGDSATISKDVNVWALPTAPTVLMLKSDGVTPETDVTVKTTGHKAKVSTPLANTLYKWGSTNATITAPAAYATSSLTNTNVTYTAGATAGTNNVVLTCTASNPAGGTVASTGKVNGVAAPVTTITVSKGALTGISIVTVNNTGLVATVPAQAGATYSWTMPAGLTLTGGSLTSNTVTFSVNNVAGTVQTLSCAVTNAAGTLATGTRPLTVRNAPAATLTVPADISYDSTGLVTHGVSVTSSSGSTYAWTFGTTDGSHPVTATSLTAASTTYKTASVAGSTITVNCTVTSQDGVATVATPKTVTVDSLPTALAITSSSTFTSSSTGNTASVDPTGTTGLTFNWSNSTGVAVTGGNNTNVVTFTAGASGAASLVCSISNKAGATTVNSTKSISINPDSTITSTTPVTVGTVNAASVPPQTGVTYTWSIIGGTGASITTGAGTNSVTYNAGTAVGNPGLTLQCVVANSASPATYNSTGTKPIQTLAAPSITSFTNNGPINVGGSANITPTFSNGTGSVDWSVGAVTSGVAKSVSPTVTTTYTLTVTNAAGTTSTAQTTVTVNPGFYAAGNTMAQNRQNHSSTELENGTVLVAGGLNSGVATNTADLFTTTTANGTFAATGNMTTTRSSHAAVRLGNGQVLIAGGVNSAGTTVATAELFNGSTFAATTGAMAAARRTFTATLLPNGKALVVGGQDNSNAYLSSLATFDPSTSTFTTLGVSLTTPRAGHTTTLMNNGKVLIFGGLTTGGTPTATFQVFDPLTSTLSTEASASGARANHTATLLPDGTVLIYGGIDGSGVVTTGLLFDPVASSFSSVAGPFAARKNHTATLLPSGQILMAGGNNGTSDVATAELFNYLTGNTTATASLTANRTNAVATLLSNPTAKYSKVLVSGGLKAGAATNTAEIYDMAVATPNPTIVCLVASSTSITAGQSISILPVFLGGTGTVGLGVGSVTSGKPFTVTPPGIAGQTAIYTLTVGAATKSVTITLN